MDSYPPKYKERGVDDRDARLARGSLSKPLRNTTGHRGARGPSSSVSSFSSRSQANYGVSKRSSTYSDWYGSRLAEARDRTDIVLRRRDPPNFGQSLYKSYLERDKKLKEHNIMSQVGDGPENRGTAMAHLRPTDKVHPREEYKIGCIFSAPHHVPANRSEDEMEVHALDRCRVATPYGIILSKYRKFVVIALHGTKAATLPIYTHKGRGLKNVQLKNEHISIRDSVEEVPSPPETSYGSLFATKLEEYKGNFLTAKTSIHLVAQNAHHYSDFATMEGHLDDDSLIFLKTLLARMAFKQYTEFVKAVPSAAPLDVDSEKEEGEITGSDEVLDEMGRILSLATEEMRRFRKSIDGRRSKEDTAGFRWPRRGFREIVSNQEYP